MNLRDADSGKVLWQGNEDLLVVFNLPLNTYLFHYGYHEHQLSEEFIAGHHLRENMKLECLKRS